MDIQKSNYGYPKFSRILDILKYTDFLISKNELWISKNRIIDILNSVLFLDIQMYVSMTFGYPKMSTWYLG